MSNSSLYNSNDIKRQVLAEFEKLLTPGESYPEDVVLNNADIIAKSLTQAIAFAYNNLGEDLDPYTALGIALDRAGQKVGINFRYPSTKAFADVTIIRDPNFPKSILPKGTEFTLEGKIFISTEDLPTTQSNLRIESEDDGLLAIYPTEASLISPIVGFETVNEVVFFVDGRNKENDEKFRVRVLEAFYQPNFGNAAFYNTLLKTQYPTLEDAQIISENTSLKAYPIFSNLTYPPYGVPTQDMLNEINSFLEEQKTFGISDTFTLSATPIILNIEISGLVPNTVETQKAITTAVTNYFNSIRRPGIPYIGSQLLQMILPSVSSIDALTPSELKQPSKNGEFYILGTLSFKEVKRG